MKKLLALILVLSATTSFAKETLLECTSPKSVKAYTPSAVLTKTLSGNEEINGAVVYSESDAVTLPVSSTIATVTKMSKKMRLISFFSIDESENISKMSHSVLVMERVSKDRAFKTRIYNAVFRSYNSKGVMEAVAGTCLFRK